MIDEVVILVDGKENRYHLEKEERRNRYENDDDSGYVYGEPYLFYPALREIEVVNIELHHDGRFPFNPHGLR